MKIVISGGASGLGESITKYLSSDYPSAQILFTYFKSEDKANKLVGLLPNAKGIHLDYEDEVSINGFIDEMILFEPDILINNAITSFTKNHFHKLPRETFVLNFKKNISPILIITQEFLRISRLRKSGKVINILSSAISGLPLTGWSEYIASKNYLLSMTKSWTQENLKFNIQCNSVSPEYMETPFNKDLDPRVKTSMVDSHPLKRLLKTDEVAKIVSFLVSAPCHLNGQNIVVNSGR